MKNNLKKVTPMIILACFTAVLAISSFNGCGVQSYTAKVAAMSIAPVTTKIGFSKTQQYTASALLSDGTSSAMADDSVTWTSSDATIATISATGLATAGTTTGTTTITAADASGIKGIATLEIGMVKAALPVTIVVLPANPSISIGKNQQFTATGTYDDASTQDVTALVTWTSSDATAVTIDAASGSATVPSSATVGATATITATLTDAGSGTTITATTVLTVAKKGSKY